MPREYKRKGTFSSAEWSEEDVQNAIEAVNQKQIGIREATRTFEVPFTTLRCSFKNGNRKKIQLGPLFTLDTENEDKLVKHIKKLQ